MRKFTLFFSIMLLSVNMFSADTLAFYNFSTNLSATDTDANLTATSWSQSASRIAEATTTYLKQDVGLMETKKLAVSGNIPETLWNDSSYITITVSNTSGGFINLDSISMKVIGGDASKGSSFIGITTDLLNDEGAPWVSEDVNYVFDTSVAEAGAEIFVTAPFIGTQYQNVTSFDIRVYIGGVKNQLTYFDDIVIYGKWSATAGALQVTVSPSIDQTLEIDSLGNELSVSSNKAVDSYQWKYGTTSGVYDTDITGETSDTYTPVFSSTGTYYVVCEATSGAEKDTTDEVKVNVINSFVSNTIATYNFSSNLAPTSNAIYATVSPWEQSAYRIANPSLNYLIQAGGRMEIKTGAAGSPTFANLWNNKSFVSMTVAERVGGYITLDSLTITITGDNDPNKGAAIFGITTALLKDTNDAWVSDAENFVYSGQINAQQTMTITVPFDGVRYQNVDFFDIRIYVGAANKNITTYYDDIVVYGKWSDNKPALEATVSPVDAQNIFTNVSGTELSVNANSVVDSYQWKYGTTSGVYDNDISGATSSTYTPLFSNAGTYYVVCEATSGAEKDTTDEVMVVVTLPVLIGNIETMEIKLWPNPANMFINIEAPINSQLVIFDVLGNRIINMLTSNFVTTIDVSAFTPGVYYVKTNEEVRRIVIE